MKDGYNPFSGHNPRTYAYLLHLRHFPSGLKIDHGKVILLNLTAY